MNKQMLLNSFLHNHPEKSIENFTVLGISLDKFMIAYRDPANCGYGFGCMCVIVNDVIEWGKPVCVAVGVMSNIHLEKNPDDTVSVEFFLKEHNNFGCGIAEGYSTATISDMTLAFSEYTVSNISVKA
jgi:hypothetical protein